MIIDCHGHFTTVPRTLHDWRKRQLAAIDDPGAMPTEADLRISDDEIRDSINNGQLRQQKARGSDLTLFSPIAGMMAHHLGNQHTSAVWARVCNDLVYRVTQLFPDDFSGVCQLPQAPDVSPANCIPELRRCVEELGFVGVNFNPDPSGGYLGSKPLTDRFWYPLYEAICDLKVGVMVHVSGSSNPYVHGTGSYYLHGDTTAFMQLLTGDLFKDFPTLQFIIPHGGGAVPFHWGRYRGLSLEMCGRPLEALLDNVSFDTCVYQQQGINLMAQTLPPENVVFGSEMIGAVKGRDPNTDTFFDDTRLYVDNCPYWTAEDRHSIFEGNIRRLYPLLDAQLKRRTLAA